MLVTWEMCLPTWCKSSFPICYTSNTDLSRNMPTSSLKPLVEALLEQLPDDPTSVVISVKSETEPPTSPNGPKSPAGPLYDPSMVYLLEFVTVLALRDGETIEALGGDVAEALQNVMRNATSYHPIMISRTMFYLLHLLRASYVSFIIPLYMKLLLTIIGTLLPPRPSCASHDLQLQERSFRQICAARVAGLKPMYQRARPPQKRNHDIS